jgi:hypothetical protein
MKGMWECGRVDDESRCEEMRGSLMVVKGRREVGAFELVAGGRQLINRLALASADSTAAEQGDRENPLVSGGSRCGSERGLILLWHLALWLFVESDVKVRPQPSFFILQSLSADGVSSTP